jgi:hypothetical protein
MEDQKRLFELASTCRALAATDGTRAVEAQLLAMADEFEARAATTTEDHSGGNAIGWWPPAANLLRRLQVRSLRRH